MQFGFIYLGIYWVSFIFHVELLPVLRRSGMMCDCRRTACKLHSFAMQPDEAQCFWLIFILHFYFSLKEKLKVNLEEGVGWKVPTHMNQTLRKYSHQHLWNKTVNFHTQLSAEYVLSRHGSMKLFFFFLGLHLMSPCHQLVIWKKYFWKSDVITIFFSSLNPYLGIEKTWNS